MPLTRFRLLTLATLIGVLFYAAPVLDAHCDTLSGPVVKAAKTALDAKDLTPLLKWVKPEAEAELQKAFERTLSVRSQGGKAKELADYYLFETAVRLHRAGEGAPYTGLKAEPNDPGGFIAASDEAVEGGSPDALLEKLTAKLAAGLRERHSRVVEARKHADHTVDAGREYVEAYVEYVHFVEALQQIVAENGHGTATATAHRHGK